MNESMTAQQLREVFLAAPESDSTRIVAIVCSLFMFSIVMWLVKRRALQEEYTPIWMAVALGLLIISARIEILVPITRALGAWTTSSTLFFLGEAFLVLISLNYAIRLSRESLRLKNVAQELALLRAQVERLEGRSGG